MLEPLSLHRLNCYLTRDSHLQSCVSPPPPSAFSAFHFSSLYDAPSSFSSLPSPLSSSSSSILSSLFRNSLFHLSVFSYTALFPYIFTLTSTRLFTSPRLTPHSLCPFVFLSIISTSPCFPLRPAPFLTLPLFSPVLSALLNRAPHYPPPASIRGS